MVKKRSIFLYGRWSPDEYARRIGVHPNCVRRWIRQGLPVEKNWYSRPYTLLVVAKKADAWLRARGENAITHPVSCVYFVQDTVTARIKIGFTDNIDRRVREHRSEIEALGHEALLIGVMVGSRELEREWIDRAIDCDCYLDEEFCWPDPEFIADLTVTLEQQWKERAA